MATKTSVNYNNNYVNESDRGSNVHYLSSSENETTINNNYLSI